MFIAVLKIVGGGDWRKSSMVKNPLWSNSDFL